MTYATMTGRRATVTMCLVSQGRSGAKNHGFGDRQITRVDSDANRGQGLPSNRYFVLGLDLDGVCADFYSRMRHIVAEWRGVDIDSLPAEVSYGLPEWELLPEEYPRIHRFAVTQRSLFEKMDVVPGAPQSIRRLGTEGVRIRIVTHRLFIRFFHEHAVAQTVRWLDHHAIPYWDLCFMRDKEAVDADVYVEDAPENIERLRRDGRDVIVFSNSTNTHLPDEPGGRAATWQQAEEMVRVRYYDWLDAAGRPRPPAPGHEPPGLDVPRPSV